MENIRNKSKIKNIVISRDNTLTKEEVQALRGTKPLRIRFSDRELTQEEIDNINVIDTNSVTVQDVTTWASVIRYLIDNLRLQLNALPSIVGNTYEVRCAFEKAVQQVSNEIGIRLNDNCPNRLYTESEELELINSKVYLGSNNHKLKILTSEEGIDYYMCAVYTEEIVIMIKSLLTIVHDLFINNPESPAFGIYRENPVDLNVIISYINREDLATPSILDEEEMETPKTNKDKAQLSKDLLLLQSKLYKVSTEIMQLYAELNEIMEDNDLDTVDNVLQSLE